MATEIDGIKKDALIFNHHFPVLENKSAIGEGFVPYSIETLFENDLVSDSEKELLSACVDFNSNLDTFVDDEALLTDDVQLNSQNNAVWANTNGIYEEACLFDYVADVPFLVELIKHGNQKQSQREIVNLGIISELTKYSFAQFKVNFSILKNLFSEKKNRTLTPNEVPLYTNVIFNLVKLSLSQKKRKDSGLTKIAIRNELKTDPNELIKKVAMEILKDIQEQLKMVYNSTSSKSYLQAIVSLMILSGKCQDWGKKKATQCFCIAKKGDTYYFALSGCNGDESWASVFSKWSKECFEKNLTISNIEYCPISEKTQAYGVRTEMGFLRFPFPLLYSNYQEHLSTIFFANNKKRYLGTLYGCCERKIFAKMKNNDKPLYMFCKWLPCEKCQEAVFDKMKGHSEFEYIALAESSKTIKDFVMGKKSNIELIKINKR